MSETAWDRQIGWSVPGPLSYNGRHVLAGTDIPRLLLRAGFVDALRQAA